MKTKFSCIILAVLLIGGVLAVWLFPATKDTTRALNPAPSSTARAESKTRTDLPQRTAPAAVANDNGAVSPELLVTAATRWREPISEPAFARFHDWSERYLATSPNDRKPLLQEGVALAEDRRKELSNLIKSNPERALELSVPMNIRQELPLQVTELLEERIAKRGDLEVMAALAEPGKESEVVPTWRLAQIGGKEYKAFVYGRRLGEPTRNNIPLNGIAVDNLLAVNAHPIRVLEPEEAAAAKSSVGEAICSVSGLSTTVVNQEVAVEVGEEVDFVCRAGHISALNNLLTQAESGAPGPVADASTPVASAWTEGEKTLILSQMAVAGTDVIFTVGVIGTSPLTYQWRFNSTNIAGATAATFTRTNLQAIHAGNYSVVVTNSLGSVTSSPAALTVGFTLSAASTYGGTVSKNPDLPIYPSGTVVTLTATPATVFPFGGWTGDASGTNNPLALVVNSNKAIVANFISPVADLIVDNPSAIFTGTWTTAASGADKYGSDYRTVGTSANSTTATATFTPTVATDGSYDVYVWFPTITKGLTTAPFTINDMNGSTSMGVDQTTGSVGWKLLVAGRNFAQGTNGFIRLGNQGGGGKTVVADAVRLVYSENQTIAPPPIITSQPTSQTVTQNSRVVFSVSASGVGTLACQWRFNSTNLFGATNGVLEIPSAHAADAGSYSIVITNLGGSVTSSVVSLTVILPPEILTQPAGESVISGRDASFSVMATGTAPLIYQWRKDGIILTNNAHVSGANAATLNISTAQSGDAGAYAVTVLNSASVTNSVQAMLTVVPETPLEIHSIGRIANGQIQLNFTGNPGDIIQIESSTNLPDWLPLTTVTNVNGSVDFIDLLSTNVPLRLYRGRIIP